MRGTRAKALRAMTRKELGQGSDLCLTGRGWRHIKRAWNRATPEERKTFHPGAEVVRMTRADAQRAVTEAHRRRLAPPPKPKLRKRLGDSFLQMLKMVGIMSAARKPRSNLKRK